MIRQHRIEHDASRRQRVGSGRAGRALEATVVDPCAVPGDAPKPSGKDVIQYAQSLQTTHVGKVHEMGRQSVAGELVAVRDKDPPSLTRQQQGQTCPSCPSADDQRIELGIAVTTGRS
jgi:hypothetical protein